MGAGTDPGVSLAAEPRRVYDPILACGPIPGATSLGVQQDMIASPFARSAAVLMALGILASASGAWPGERDDDSRAPSFPIDAEAKAFAGRFDRTELVKDEVFIKALGELARSKLSPEAKAD